MDDKQRSVRRPPRVDRSSAPARERECSLPGDCESGDRQRQRSEAGSEHPTLCLGKTPGQDGLAALLLLVRSGPRDQRQGWVPLPRAKQARQFCFWRTGGARRRAARDPLSLPQAYHELCAVAGCVRNAVRLRAVCSSNRASSPGEGSVSALRVLLSGCALADSSQPSKRVTKAPRGRFALIALELHPPLCVSWDRTRSGVVRERTPGVTLAGWEWRRGRRRGDHARVSFGVRQEAEQLRP